MTILLILPNTLFKKKYIPSDINTIIIWEHPQYFTKYIYNKKKLILHRASLKYYENIMSKYYSVQYIQYQQKPVLPKDFIYFDPIDNLNITNGKKIQSPNFLISDELIKEYRNYTNNFFFNYFYMWFKKKINIIPNVKSQDKLNRQKITKKIIIPKLPNIKNDDIKYINEAKKYIENNFPDNYGNINGFIYPVTHNGAKKWLNNFISKRLKKFGDYQDYTLKENDIMFHSCLSSSINIGLLNPAEIIIALNKIKPQIPINSFEGIIRQYFWREYQRYCYIYLNTWYGNNYFENNSKLNKKWYIGATGIDPVDDSIKVAFEMGYLHHIRRLMIIANFMNLCGINYKEGFKWFMEFSVDSYEWVMYQNIDMGFFASGGKTMKRPYISSSNYIIKMSNYRKGEWSNIWDSIYHEFLEKQKNKLWKYRHFFPNKYLM